MSNASIMKKRNVRKLRNSGYRSERFFSKKEIAALNSVNFVCAKISATRYIILYMCKN
jgi:hypothetical protein